MRLYWWLRRHIKLLLFIVTAIFYVPLILFLTFTHIFEDNDYSKDKMQGLKIETVSIDQRYQHLRYEHGNKEFHFHYNNILKSHKIINDTTINHKDIRVFYSLKDAEDFMRTVKDIRQSPRIVIGYGPYAKHEPNFIDKEDRDLFYASPKMRSKMYPASPEELTGIIDNVPNGTYQHYFDCGWNSHVSHLTMNRKVNKKYSIFLPLVLDTAYVFQHFYASTLPKLTQIYEYIRRPEVTILLEKPSSNNKIIYSLLERYNITANRIEWHEQRDHKTVYGADHMLFTCNTPPTHPELWKRIRYRLGVHDDYTVRKNQTKVIFLSRKFKRNRGANRVRSARNENEVMIFLRQRYGSERVISFTESQGFENDLKLFSEASVIIGVHGGAFYNINFAPLHAAVIEFVPTLGDGSKDIRHCSTSIFWIMADLLGQNYWRIQSQSFGSSNSVYIDLKKLERILDNIEKGISPRNEVEVFESVL